VLEPVVEAAYNNNERYSEHRFEVFGEFHRRISPDWKSNEAGCIRFTEKSQ
jgi:hypothetical protein